jgi:D-amino-acid dehydrogenase
LEDATACGGPLTPRLEQKSLEKSISGAGQQSPDVLIIGGGVIGVCTAYYAAKAGRTVTLLERGEICSGCSSGNAGWLVPSHCIPLAAPGVLSEALKWMWRGNSPFSIKARLDWELLKWLVAFAASCSERNVRNSIPVIRDLTFASLNLYDELSSESGMSFGYRRDGCLALFATETGFVDGQRDAQLLRDNGIASQVLGPGDVLHQEPSVVSDVAGGILYPQDGQIVPVKFVQVLAERAQGFGATVLSSTEVRGFELSGARIRGVQTTQGEFFPRAVVLAAGVDSSALARMLNINLPIQAGKGYSFSIPSSTFYPRRPLLLSEAKVAITPFGEKVRFAGTLQLSGIDNTIDATRLNGIRESSSKYFSTPLPTTVNEQWSGLRPCTPDGLPVISFSSTIRNLVVASGHAMLGVSLGPITGKLAAQLVTDEQPNLDLSPLSLSRFH